MLPNERLFLECRSKMSHDETAKSLYSNRLRRRPRCLLTRILGPCLLWKRTPLRWDWVLNLYKMVNLWRIRLGCCVRRNVSCPFLCVSCWSSLRLLSISGFTASNSGPPFLTVVGEAEEHAGQAFAEGDSACGAPVQGYITW